MIDIGIDKPGHSLRLLVYQALKLYDPDVLISFLTDGDCIVRSAAARDLHIRGGRAAFEAAANMSTSRRVVDREVAAFLLGQLGAPDRLFKSESFELLAKLLHDSSPTVRESAATALGHLQATEAIPFLINISGDTCAKVRAAIAFALTMLPKNADSVRCLKKLSCDPDDRVRYWTED